MSTTPTSDGPENQPSAAPGTDPTVDETVRPPLVAGALANRGLVEPEGVNAADDGETTHDVRSGGRPTAAPVTDRPVWKTDDELVGAGPKDQSELNHADDVQDIDES